MVPLLCEVFEPGKHRVGGGFKGQVLHSFLPPKRTACKSLVIREPCLMVLFVLGSLRIGGEGCGGICGLRHCDADGSSQATKRT